MKKIRRFLAYHVSDDPGFWFLIASNACISLWFFILVLVS